MGTQIGDTSDFRQHLRGLKSRWNSNVVARTAAYDFSGGAVSPGTLANADSKGEGPNGAFKIGRNTVYPIDSLIDWLIDRASRVRKKPYRYLSESRKRQPGA